METYGNLIRAKEALYLVGVEIRFNDGGDIVRCLCLEHVLAFHIVGELRWSDVLGDCVAD